MSPRHQIPAHLLCHCKSGGGTSRERGLKASVRRTRRKKEEEEEVEKEKGKAEIIDKIVPQKLEST